MNREEWLTTLAGELAPLFELAGHPLPKTRITCGFPSTFRRSKVLGECWPDKASADGTWEILISPTVAESGLVMTVLINQLCLASKADPVAMGLDAAGALTDGRYFELLAEMGEYPHAAITIGEKPVQTTRMLKASCPSCGYMVRLSYKWAKIGMPICPVERIDMVLEAAK